MAAGSTVGVTLHAEGKPLAVASQHFVGSCCDAHAVGRFVGFLVAGGAGHPADLKRHRVRHAHCGNDVDRVCVDGIRAAMALDATCRCGSLADPFVKRQVRNSGHPDDR